MRPLLKLRSSGRGRGYSAARGLLEWSLGMAYGGGWPARLWARVPGATRVDLVRHQLPVLPRNGAPREPLRLAFISDMHIGPTTPHETLDNAFALVRAVAPDVLILGGDYVYLDATDAAARELQDRVAAVPAVLKLAVLGNHDLWTDHRLIEDALARAGVRVLVNEAIRLGGPHADVAIVGLDDPWTGDPDGRRAFAAASDAAVRIAVCHSPDGWPAVRGRGAAIMLCGHTHGGQVALPSGPVVVHSRYGRRWHSGLHVVEGMKLFVSRGVGGVEIPMRANARPDVSLFTIAEADPA